MSKLTLPHDDFGPAAAAVVATDSCSARPHVQFLQARFLPCGAKVASVGLSRSSSLKSSSSSTSSLSVSLSVSLSLSLSSSPSLPLLGRGTEIRTLVIGLEARRQVEKDPAAVSQRSGLVKPAKRQSRTAWGGNGHCRISSASGAASEASLLNSSREGGSPRAQVMWRRVFSGKESCQSSPRRAS